MAGMITPSDISFNGREIQSLREAVIEKVYEKPAITSLLSVQSGIKQKQQIAYLGRLGQIGRKTGDAQCAPATSSESISMAEKFWEPVMVDDRFAQCWKDLLPSFWGWGLKNNVEKANLDGTEFANFLADRLGDAIVEALLRIAYFGDTNAALVTSSPAGYITAGKDVALFNAIDGIWPQLISIGTADANRRVTISKNTQTTYAAQAFNTTDTSNKVAIGIMESLKYQADMRLRGQQDAVIYCTQSLFDQYAKELRSQSLDTSFVKIEEGYDGLMFEGIPIIPIHFWDRIIREYFDDGTTYYLPHRAVLSTRDNLALGAEGTADDMLNIHPFYDDKDAHYYVDMGFSIDAKVIEDELVQVAY